MRAPFVALLTILLVCLAADAYIYVQLRRRCKSRFWPLVQLVSALLLLGMMIVEMCLLPKQIGEKQLLGKMWLLYTYLSIYLPKYVAILFDLIASLPRLWHRHRIKWLTATGIGAAVVIFAAMWWGALINRFNIDVTHVDVPVPGLPASMNGLRIVQFSDLHTGTFGRDTTFTSELIDSINAQHADVIVFTGDIVNRHSGEMEPFVRTLSRLHAPMGVYAILGNHDYGDYFNWPAPQIKQANMQLLYDLYKQTGIRLLRNETVWLRRGADSLALIGVENIGEPPFTTYGSLRRAYPNLSDSIPKVLLSHNPRHWTDSIATDPAANVALTLSGHTHAMQIEIGKWSPSAWRYDTWGGMYTDDAHRQLYVNIGAGTVGMPMRIGATPEITVITLHSIP